MKIILKRDRTASVLRRHPWIFSGGIHKIEGEPKNGDTVWIYDAADNCIATGHYQNSSIAVRIVAFEKVETNQYFWTHKIRKAYELRQHLGLADSDSTNVFRLINAAGDGMPGLIADFYNGTIVLQTHTLGMHRAKPFLIQAFQEVLGDKLQAIYDKSHKTVPTQSKSGVKDDYIFGEASTNVVLENDHQFWVDWEKGQKTGFFIDQRESRQLLTRFVKGKKVLNTFCYSGGFSVYALQAGAALVHSVDSSAKAIAWTAKNMELNQVAGENHQAYTQDVIKFLKNTEEKYEVIILDPPAYAKHIRSRHKAVIGYQRLNMEALSRIESGGILFTFSCSQVVGKQLFLDTIRAAAIKTGREVKLLAHLSQPSDHPVSMYHAEGSYLKGLVLQVI